MSRLLFVVVAALLAAPALIPQPSAQPWLPSSAPATAPTLPELIFAADEKEAFAEAERLLREGDLDAAREAGLQALASYPFSDTGYQLMHRIAVAAEDKVDALRWAKWLYWSRKYTGRSKELEELAPLFEDQWEGWNQDEQILATWDEAMREAAKKAGSKKQYRLAGHLMDRLLELNADDKKLLKDYEKLADKAGQQLSGGAFVAASIRRKSPDWLARENTKHEHWENPFERETKNYEIYCNVSWEFTETLTAAMDEINQFYREIYDYKKKAKATIHVMRRRSDFDKMSLKVLQRAMPSRGVGGYWVPAQRTVVAYDRAYDEEGFTQDALWQTLFHEASHQFMTLLSKDRHVVPTWLNEGTASYFEGCEIKADGTIVKNAPAVHRLRAWYAIDNSASRHSLEDLVAHPRNTGADQTGSRSYEGSFYPYGWAFVYFLLNYEENDRRVYGQAVTDDGRIPEDYKAVKKAGRLVYRDAYDKYLKHFSDRGSNGDRFYPMEIAKKYFIEEIDDPDVQDWDAFEARWRKFCTSLYQEEMSGPEFADVLQARSRGYMLAEDWERARITAEQADSKRPSDPETYRLLALANSGEGRKEDAVYWMVRHWELMYPANKESEVLEAEEWLADHGGKDVLEHYIIPTREAVEGLADAADTALDAGEPMAATLFAVHGCEVLGMDHPSLTQHIGVGIEPGESFALELTEKDLRMWQRAFERGEEGNRTFNAPGMSVDVVKYESDGLFMNNPEGEARPGMERVSRRSLNELTAPFEIRGSVQAEGRAAMNLGMDRNGRPRAALLFEIQDGTPVCRVCVVDTEVDVDGGRAFTRLDQIGGFSFPKGDTFKFHFLVSGDEPSWMIGNDSEKAAFPEEYTPKRLNGAIGLDVHEGAVALWSDIEIRPSRPFWPVP